MSLPVPDNLPTSVQILIWGLVMLITGLVSVAAFLIIRYINRKDKRDDELYNRLRNQERTNLDQSQKIEKVTAQVEKTLARIEKIGGSVEKQIYLELKAIKDEVLTLKSSLVESQSCSKVILERMAILKRETEKLYERTERFNIEKYAAQIKKP